MDLLSIFKRKSGSAASPSPDAADAVQHARTRARRRLIGAAVLVVVGIIGFPLLFETQPRPVAVDIPIDIPGKDRVPPLVMPAAKPEPAAGVAIVVPPKEAVITESKADAGREVAPSQAPQASAAAAVERARPEPAASRPAAKATESKAAPAAQSEAERAQALLEGRPVAAAPAAADPPAAAASAGRYVVQVGAFAEAAAAREARLKVEKLGLKTYTQVAETPAGQRTRVRVGPFAKRDEADRAAAKLKAAALPAVILAL